jgi:hypothetical protein
MPTKIEYNPDKALEKAKAIPGLFVIRKKINVFDPVRLTDYTQARV